MGLEMHASVDMTEGICRRYHGQDVMNQSKHGTMLQGILMMRANSFVCDGVAGMQTNASKIHMTD
jgi:hypothetical protein